MLFNLTFSIKEQVVITCSHILSFFLIDISHLTAFLAESGPLLPENHKVNESNTALIMCPGCSAVTQHHRGGQMVTNTGQAFPGHLSVEGQLLACPLPACL